MADQIKINGRSVATDDLARDASGSNYILIRTTGQPLKKAQKDQLASLSVAIREFVGDRTSQVYLCSYRPSSLDEIRGLDFIDYANVYAPKFAVPDVVQKAAGDADGNLEVDILLHQDIGSPDDDLLDRIAQAAGVDRAELDSRTGAVRIKLDQGALDRVAGVDEVRVIHTVKTHRLFNNEARRILHLATPAPGATSMFRGSGQIVCVADTGFDKGSKTDVLDDFSGRVRDLHAWGRPTSGRCDDPDGHGTHVCGSVLGSGRHPTQGVIEGAAPEATLIVQSTFSGFNGTDAQLGGIPGDLGRLFDQAYQDNARVHTNSWGVPLPDNGVQIPYENFCEDIDKFVWEHQDMTILFAAGNSGLDSDLDGKVNDRSLGAEAAAKNCITVGATENNRPDLKSGAGIQYKYGSFWPNDFPKDPLKSDHMSNNPEGLAAFSSRGPTAEDRIKPDVVAPGTAILSTLSRNKKFREDINVFGDSGDGKYWYLAGTSMATPLVAGCCAVIREALAKMNFQDEVDGVKQPTGSLVKALLINGAVPIQGQYMPKEVGPEPNSHSGFGRVDMSASIPNPDNKNAGHGTGIVSAQDEASVVIRIPIPKSVKTTDVSNGAGISLKTTLVYADQPGGALNNDLNLIVVAGKHERHGNQVGREFPVGATDPFDGDNNVEQVLWPQISGESVDIIVKPFRLLDNVPFAYAWRFF